MKTLTVKPLALILCIAMMIGVAVHGDAEDISSEPSSWAKDEVEAAIAANLVPVELKDNYTDPITRGQVAAMFIRLLEKAAGKSAEEIVSEKAVSVNEEAFTDTNDRNVILANALGIINGIGTGKFAPDHILKRAQIAAVINRVASVMGIDTKGYDHYFTDITGSYLWAEQELGWPVATEIIKGVGGTRFSPDGDLTTEQAILITYRAYNELASNVLRIYVSPEGSKKPKGSRTAPFGDIQSAVDSIRTISRDSYDRIEVVLLDGIYTVDKAIGFHPDFTKSQACPIVIRGSGNTTISGGISLSSSDFIPAEGDIAKLFRDDVRSKIVMVDLKDFGYPIEAIKEAKARYNYLAYAPMLSCNGAIQTLARYPNDNWINIEGGWITDENGNTIPPATEQSTEPPSYRYTVDCGTEHSNRIGSWSRTDPVFAEALLNDLRHCDNSELLFFDQAKDLVYLTYFNGNPAPVRGGLIYFYNIPEELDSPGEYYISDDGILYYYPSEGFDDASLAIPVSEGLFNLVYAENVTLSGIHFTLSRNNGIVAGNVDQLTIKDCEISLIQGYSAIKVHGYNIIISGNDIHDCGEHAIQVDSGHFESAENGNCEIYNNRMYRYGQFIWPYANGIFANGVGIHIHHNEICDSKSIGIYWRKGMNITVEYNDIHDVLIATDNLGAIYCTGRVHARNTIRYNYIHDIGATGQYSQIKEVNPDYTYYGCSAIGGADGASYFEAYGNVIQTVNGNGFQGDGREIVFRNNLVIDCSNWYVWITSKQYADYFKGGSSNSRYVTSDFIYSKPWKEANPDLAHIITDLSQTTFDDSRAWAAPVGNVIENNWIHFNKTGRYFTNWGVAPYSIEDTVYQFSSDTLDVEMYERSNNNVSVYNSRRDKLDIESLLSETSRGLVELTVEQFKSIGCE